MLWFERQSLITGAKDKSTRIKAAFRQLESKAEGKTESGRLLEAGKTQSGELTKQKVDVAAPVCSCCGEELQLPCWICIECEHDTLLCTACDASRKRCASDHPSHSTHSYLHHALWIRTSQLVSARKPTPQTEIAKLDKRLDDIEGRIHEKLETRMTSLEGGMSALGDRIVSVEQQFSQKVTVLEGKFATLESKMDRMISLLECPPWARGLGNGVHPE